MSTTSAPVPEVYFTLPHLLVNFPWPPRLSEHYCEAKAESIAWTESYHPFDEDGLKGFNLCDLSSYLPYRPLYLLPSNPIYLLASMAYAPPEKGIIRLGCDLMNLFWVIDEYTDIAEGEGAQKIREIVMDAFRNPHKIRPEGECPVGAMTRDYWIRASSIVSPDAHCLRHFIQDFDTYTVAVVREADDRTKRIYRSFQDYLVIRRDSSGGLPSFALSEFGLDLPEEAFHHPLMSLLREQATDLIAVGNDISSYAMEKSRGLELHNSVELVMKERGLDVQDSIDWLEQYTAAVEIEFIYNIEKLPSWGEDVDRRVKIYTDGLAQWVRANDDWTFESGRYFGRRGLEVKERIMTLLPPTKGYVKAA